MDTYRFAQGESNLEISFALWLIHHPAISVLKAWILQALLPEPEARPSARDLSSKLIELAVLLSPSPILGDTNLPLTISNREEHSLGTDVPVNNGILRWEQLFCNGHIEQHVRKLHRYDRVVRTRTELLGTHHVYTLWSKIQFAWACSYLGHYDDAARFFEEVWVAKKAALGIDHSETLAA